MKSENLETIVKNLTQTVEKLEARLTITEDIEAIKKLQYAYGYYLEHWQEDELIGLFSHASDVTIEINAGGQYKGWEGVLKAFSFSGHYTAFGGVKQAPPEYLHILMPNCGIVDVDPDGKEAKGRWYGLFLGAMPRGGKLRALIGCGIWENEYVKEDGIWKINKLFFNDIISSPWTKVGLRLHIWRILRTGKLRRPAPIPILRLTLRAIFSLTTIKILSPGSKNSNAAGSGKIIVDK
jgi:hypothetical protein